MTFLYCSNPISKARPDPAYIAERDAAESQGFQCSLINFEALLEGDTQRAVSRVINEAEKGAAIFRGWMMKPSIYRKLYNALYDFNVRLINSPDEYRHCHYLPESFDIIRGKTPRSVWFKINGNLDMNAVYSALGEFGSNPVIVKDYVKSRKHEWQDAFFIPAADDRVIVQKVVTNFVNRQGEDLNEGLVFREFLQFEAIGNHPKSGSPLFDEYRLFFLNGSLVDMAEYWEAGAYTGERPPLDEFCEIAKRVQSHFFTMDVAKMNSGKWMIIELGDGQVAGLPEQLDINSFYTKLSAALQQN